MKLAPAPLIAALMLAAGPAGAGDSIWDLKLGEPAAVQPSGFVDYACGGNGGPPTAPLGGFADFATCAPESDGLHEVYFRYADEADTLREAWQRWPLARLEGTRVYGFRAVLSALFDASGTLAGLRVLADPRGVPAGERNDQWRLAAVLQQHFADATWTCEDAALRARESAAASFSVKRSCTGTAEGRDLSLAQEYFHKAGQGFVDEFGKVQETYFVSNSRFEIRTPGDD